MKYLTFVQPNFIKLALAVLFCAVSTAAFAEHHKSQEKVAEKAKNYDSRKLEMVEESLSQEELNMEIEKEKHSKSVKGKEKDGETKESPE